MHSLLHCIHCTSVYPVHNLTRDLLSGLSLYLVTLPNYDSDEVSEGTLEVVEVRILSATNSDNHWEKLCKVLRVGKGIPDTKHDPFKSEIGKFYGTLKLYLIYLYLKMASWAQQVLLHIQLMKLIIHPLSNLKGVFLSPDVIR